MSSRRSASTFKNFQTVRNWLISLTLPTGMGLRPWKVSRVESKVFYQVLTTSVDPRAFTLAIEHTLPISTLLGNKKDSVSSCLKFVCFLYYIQKVDIAKLECLFWGVLVNKMVTDTWRHISNVIDLILLLSLHCLRALFMRWSQFIAMFSPFILLMWTWRGTRSFVCIFGCNNSFIHLYRRCS